MSCHFVERWRQRGIPEIDGEDVMHRIRRAYLNGELEQVFEDHRSGRMIYRFLVDGRPFYTVFADGWPLTVIKQEWMRRKRFARKIKRKKPNSYRRMV